MASLHTLIALLSLAFLLLISLPVCSPLSTVSISHTPDHTLICALIPAADGRSYLNCSSFPDPRRSPVAFPGVPVAAVAGGAGFVCALIDGGGNGNGNVSIRCWRFSGNGTVTGSRGGAGKRIYTGPPLDELAAGPTHLCGVVTGASGVECWQWRRFDSRGVRNITGLAVGGDFVCGLSPSGEVECQGSDVAPPPRGSYSAIAAGERHACAVSLDGRVECWGPAAGEPPLGRLERVAAGGNRSCAVRENGTAVCWAAGEDFRLPEALAAEEFVAIEGEGGVFCGVLSSNYSLLCWGDHVFDAGNFPVFARVLPGPCRTTACPCSPIPNSAALCPAGAVCLPCPPLPESPSSPPADYSRRGGISGRNLAFVIVGSVGSTLGIVSAAYFLIVRFCAGGGCRVHDSGRLEDEGGTGPQEPSAEVQRVVPAKQPSHLVSLGPLEEFPLRDLAAVTDGFSAEHRIGSGSFGSVYRATLADGRDVAIKRAEPGAASAPAKREEREYAYVAELALLSRVNHLNLVRLVGFCDEGPERVLVYDYMPNGTLHDHLHRLQSSPLDAWAPRLRVALDAARGIEYLHTYAVPTIIHRDIKSSNILLDESWTAKVADFGLSLLGPTEDRSHLSMRAAGTVGYIDPEYYRLQVLTAKSDVYSFGVVLLELLTGQKAIHRLEEDDCGGDESGRVARRNLVDYAVPFIVSDEVHRVLDPRVPLPAPYEIEAVTYVGYLAADCVRLEGRDRPSMTEIVASLERALATCVAIHVLSGSDVEISVTSMSRV